MSSRFSIEYLVILPFESEQPLPFLLGLMGRFRIFCNITRVQEHLNSVQKKAIQYIIMDLLESQSVQDDTVYERLNNQANVIMIMKRWNSENIPLNRYEKVFFVADQWIDLFVTLYAANHLEMEAIKQTNAGDFVLRLLYTREANSLRNALFSSMKAQPCDILIVPLNADGTTTINAQKRVQSICNELGYQSATINVLSDYIPEGHIYNKMPNGRTLFKHMEKATICRWIRDLSQIRLYLCGNAMRIFNSWSEIMIEEETNASQSNKSSQDQWWCFYEHEPIRDDLKWNFRSLFGKKWSKDIIRVLKQDSLKKSFRFQSALRQALRTVESRQNKVTAEVLQGLDSMTETFEENYPPTMDIDELKDRLHTQSRALMSRFSNSANVRIDVSLVSADRTENEFLLESSKLFQKNPRFVLLLLDKNHEQIQERFRNLGDDGVLRTFTDINSCKTFLDQRIIEMKNTALVISPNSFLTPKDLGILKTLKLSAICCFETNCPQTEIPNLRVFSSIDSLLDSLNKSFVKDQELSEEEKPLIKVPSYTSLILYNESSAEYDRYQEFQKYFEVTEDLETIRERIGEIILNYPIILNAVRKDPEISPIKCYTAMSNFYSEMNQMLRTMDTFRAHEFRDIVICLIDELSSIQRKTDWFVNRPSVCFRSQMIDQQTWDLFQENLHQIFITPSFLSATGSLDVARVFSGQTVNQDLFNIIFAIDFDPTKKFNRPFAPISAISIFPEEDEFLFAPGNCFRLRNIEYSDEIDSQVVHFTLVDLDEMRSLKMYRNPADAFFSGGFQTEEIPIWGLGSLLEESEHGEKFRTLLKSLNVKLMENVDHPEEYRPSSFQQPSILIKSKISIDPEKLTLCDLVFLIFAERLRNGSNETNWENFAKNFVETFAETEDEIYVEILDDTSKNERLETKTKNKHFPFIFSFCQIENAMNFLRTLDRNLSAPSVKLILRIQSDQIRKYLSEFESINLIRSIYICSENDSCKFKCPKIHEQFSSLNQLFLFVTSEQMWRSTKKTYEQIQSKVDRRAAVLSLDKSEHFFRIFTESQS